MTAAAEFDTEADCYAQVEQIIELPAGTRYVHRSIMFSGSTKPLILRDALLIQVEWADGVFIGWSFDAHSECIAKWSDVLAAREAARS